MKDLDSVISKLDGVFTFIVAAIVVLVFLSLISASTASIITSASGTVLALSWLFSATAQEFLASIIFVFVKHPFDGNPPPFMYILCKIDAYISQL